ncbi:hypothetical protein H5203_21480 [Pseudoalteromonas sp. SG41-1]|uniref:hypothetical protein n=1 Tax=Pseudoalteromonas sp. SG41-1 TaxID=2760979 RepID=UPI0016019654|nr:hypothetical protein [Pseudoalteromonas sp. SG41-1]MBB1508018.1 hypothetical protein [Pseudoalteromonas sp. SG41-1]
MFRLLTIMVLSSFSIYAENINEDVLKYDSNKIGSLKKDLSVGQNFEEEYKTGIFSEHKYKNVPLNELLTKKIFEGDVFECDTGEKNLNTFSGTTHGGEQKRVIHDVWGYVGDNDTVVLGDMSKAMIYDSTSLYGGNQDLSGVNAGIEAISKRMIEVYRKNTTNGRFCKTADLREVGEYIGVSKGFCSAGLESVEFLGVADELGNQPECKFILDKNIKVGELRFIRQLHNSIYVSGFVECSIENEVPVLKVRDLESLSNSSIEDYDDTFCISI